MPLLRLPCADARTSFLRAMAEFAAEGRGKPDDDSMIGRELRAFGDQWQTKKGFAEYVDRLVLDALPETPRAPGWVPCTTWWWCEGDAYLGRIALRHQLTPALLERGGHIGYDVRPSARRLGHATAMLRAVLPEAFARGIDPALLTCDVDNAISRRVIEHAGGEFENQLARNLRFWLATRQEG